MTRRITQAIVRRPWRALAIVAAGSALVLISAVLVLGLGVLLAAGSLSIAYFALLTVLAVTAALAADLLLLPTLLGGRSP